MNMARNTSQQDKELLLKIGDDDGDEMARRNPSAKHAIMARCQGFSLIVSIYTIASGFLFAVAVVLLVILLTQHQHQPEFAIRNPLSTINTTTSPTDWKACGSTASEARAQNCRFDLMLTTWLHESCIDTPLMERYLAAGQYRWFADVSLTIPVPDSVVRRGEHERVYVRKDFHFSHCAYVWEMQMRAFRRRKGIDNVIWEEEHTMHCAGLLVNHTLDRNVTRLKVGFDKCGLPRIRSLGG